MNSPQAMGLYMNEEPLESSSDLRWLRAKSIEVALSLYVTPGVNRGDLDAPGQRVVEIADVICQYMRKGK